MKTSSSARGAAKLRLIIAEIIAENFKAYDFPTLGERLGLSPGTESEAMNSKRMYLSKRLNALGEQELRRVGRELAPDIEHDELDRLLAGASTADEAISTMLDRFDNDVNRKSVGKGKSVSVRVDLGGRRIIKK